MSEAFRPKPEDTSSLGSCFHHWFRVIRDCIMLSHGVAYSHTFQPPVLDGCSTPNLLSELVPEIVRAFGVQDFGPKAPFASGILAACRTIA